MTTRNWLPQRSLPPTALVLLSIGSTQLGSAIAKTLFDELGPAGATFLRVGLATLVLLAIWRPPLCSYSRHQFGVMGLFGLNLAAMNLFFYAAIARIPIGIAVAIEFLGPLGISVLKSRKRLDFVWVALAGLGILLLSPWGQSNELDPVGLGFALLAGCMWGLYIVLSARTGQVASGGQGLAVAMTVAAIALLPLGVVSAGPALLEPHLLLQGFGVAMLSSVVTYSLELEALRTMPMTVFGVLMSLEPMVAAVLAFLVLKEALTPNATIAVVAIAIAAAGISLLKPSSNSK
ncbi:MAG: EamA family transporter [Cyanobacteria bacterium P01_E01_bin.34]